MKEISLHILDVAQNSISAQAELVALTVTLAGGLLTIVIDDDGRGMSPDFLATVTDPFTTTRTTRKVGLGLPLLKLAAEMTGGSLTIQSQVGKGTTVTAVFHADSIDCPPLGDMAATVALLIQGLPDGMELTYTYNTFTLDTRQLRELLGGVPLGTPEVTQWISEYVAENQ